LIRTKRAYSNKTSFFHTLNFSKEKKKFSRDISFSEA
jgi:hypothetical protein